MIKSKKNNRSKVEDVDVISQKKGRNKREKPLRKNAKHKNEQERKKGPISELP
jgi:hypothetical protein